MFTETQHHGRVCRATSARSVRRLVSSFHTCHSSSPECASSRSQVVEFSSDWSRSGSSKDVDCFDFYKIKKKVGILSTINRSHPNTIVFSSVVFFLITCPKDCSFCYAYHPPIMLFQFQEGHKCSFVYLLRDFTLSIHFFNSFNAKALRVFCAWANKCCVHNCSYLCKCSK